MLAIDWSSITLDNDADALALWERIAPTGDDYTLKLDEIPDDVGRKLAIALLRAGNFTCMTPPTAKDCARVAFDVDPPKPTATHADPCLRRVLALWAIDQIEPDDLQSLLPTFRAILAIPPPESELIAAVLGEIPETQQDLLLELLAIAWKAGHHELVDGLLGKLDESHLKAALAKHHIDGAIEILAAESNRPLFLAAIVDDQLGSKARSQAITELVAAHDKLPADVRGPLTKAAASKDCAVAAAAARAFERRGDKRFLPKRPPRATTATMMRSLCILASYEALQGSDEPSLLPTYLPAKGLERVDIELELANDVDTDGDGDPRTNQTVDLVPKAQAVLPEVEDMARAMKTCKGTVCASNDRVFTFVLKPGAGGLVLQRLEIAERPRCNRPTP